MAFLAAALPVLSSIAGVASAGVGIASAFKKSPSGPKSEAPKIDSTATEGRNLNSAAARMQLISTSPQGLLGSAPVTRGRLLSG